MYKMGYIGICYYSCLQIILGKIIRLKQAKEEAQAEIQSFRQEKEKELQEFESKVKSNFDLLCLFIKIYKDLYCFNDIFTNKF